MQFIRPFKNFDPINGELSNTIPPVIHYYLKTAREILVNRNYDEIKYAISTINYLLGGRRELLTNSSNEKKTSNKEIKTTSIKEILDQLITEHSYFTPSSLIYGIYCNFDIEIAKQEDFPNASWAEYFAVLVLAEIAELQETDISSLDIAEISSRSSEIAEATAYAKLLLKLANLDSRPSKYVLSLKGKKGAIKSHEATNNICAEYIIWFDEVHRPGKSDLEINLTKAAEEFYRLRILPLISKDHLHPLAAQKKKNAVRMLIAALREHRRSRGEL